MFGTRVHAHAHMHTHMHMLTHTHTCMHSCMHVHMHTHTHMHAHAAYTCTRTRIHAHAHAYNTCMTAHSVVKTANMSGLKRQQSRACDAGPVPHVSDDDLKQTMLSHADSCLEAFDLGPYATMKRTGGADGAGLVQNKSLLEGLFKIQPSGRFLFVQLERSVLAVLDNKPHINVSKFSNDHFARWAAKQILVLLAHVRRIMSCEERYAAAVRRCDSIQKALLDHLLINCRSFHSVGAKRRRVLRRDVSVDDQGWPRQHSSSEQAEESEEEEQDEEEEDGEQEEAEDVEEQDDGQEEQDEEQEGQDSKEEEDEEEEAEDVFLEEDVLLEEDEEDHEPFNDLLEALATDFQVTSQSSSSQPPCRSKGRSSEQISPPVQKRPAAQLPTFKRPSAAVVPLPRFVKADSPEGQAYIAALQADVGKEASSSAAIPAGRRGAKGDGTHEKASYGNEYSNSR